MEAHRLPARAIRLEYPDDLDAAWSRRFPEFACAANSVSLLMPYAEPYFVKSVRSALPQLDGDLEIGTESYLKQELQHYRQHRRFNDLVELRYPRITTVEGWMRRTYGWLSRTRSQRFNLAFAAGSETIAFAMARWIEEHLGQLFTGADATPATLFLWHLAEEVEHKSAAFDVFEAVDGSRWRYARATTLSFMILVWFTVIATFTMLFADRRAFLPVTWFRLIRWSFSMAFVLLPTLLVSALPGHHPSAFADPIWLSAWLREYDPATDTLPEPGVLADF